MSEDIPTDAAILVEGLDESFWRLLEADLYGARLRPAKRLLEQRIRHQLQRKRYPHEFGARLGALVQSVAPAVRRRRSFFPLMPAAKCFEIGGLASEHDQHDAATLVGAALGRFDVVSARRSRVARRDRSVAAPTRTLDATLDAISAERLAEDIGIPADEARGAFVLPGVVVDDYDEFNDTITAFHLSLLRHTDGAGATPQPDNALALLENAYGDAGGLAAARSEAKFALKGGMRRILDLMTERFKQEQRFKRVHRMLTEALDPLDWDRQLTFMSALLARLRPHLPNELCSADPARYVRRRDEIVRVYVDALDRVQSLMRTL
ncbi:MAG: hypothetical protein J5J06_16245 [Phycisphaerae bacterium]|nr:hypothetical protein [Phycisphaerae bacterium]